jgi:hypothetical protein
MNEWFRIAKQRISHDMDTFLALLVKEWTKTKDSDPMEIAFDTSCEDKSLTRLFSFTTK